MDRRLPDAIATRRPDLDSLRVLALCLLIIYHAMLVFSPREEWRVTSTHAGQWADYIITALSPWRMSLVFFVGGCAARFMIERAAIGDFIRERAGKLLTAFVFAVIVLVPLQRYVRLDEAGVDRGGYFDYLLQVAPHVVNYQGLGIPEFAHAWFLPYLFAYSVGAAMVWRFAPVLFARLQQLIERAPLAIWVGLTMAWFAFIEAVVLPAQPMSGILPTDITAHLKFIPIFFLGVLVGKSAVFLSKLTDARTWLWPVALTLMALVGALQWRHMLWDPELRDAEALLLAARGVYGGAMMFGVTAFGAFALNKPSAALTYLSDAILPVYLMHQTTLVVAADVLAHQNWPVAAELLGIIAAAGLFPLLVYQVLIRHAAALRVLFGLRPRLKEVDRKLHGFLRAPAGELG